MFQPVIPMSGIGGWNFLQATYDQQLATFADSAQVRNDRAYMEDKLSVPIAVEDLLDDRRLLRTTLTAFNLGGEEWKRGFIDKILSEASDPESTFLDRLNNTQYTQFAEALSPRNGTISISAETLAEIGAKFEAVSFKTEVGEIDNSMRLALNFQTEVPGLIGNGSNEDAALYRLLGSVPVRTVLETATGLPSDISSLSIEKQAEMLREKLESRFGITDLSQLASPETMNRVIERFHAIESITQGPSATAPGSVALALLTGVGSGASENLFLSALL